MNVQKAGSTVAAITGLAIAAGGMAFYGKVIVTAGLAAASASTLGIGLAAAGLVVLGMWGWCIARAKARSVGHRQHGEESKFIAGGAGTEFLSAEKSKIQTPKGIQDEFSTQGQNFPAARTEADFQALFPVKFSCCLSDLRWGATLRWLQQRFQDGPTASWRPSEKTLNLGARYIQMKDIKSLDKERAPRDMLARAQVKSDSGRTLRTEDLSTNAVPAQLPSKPSEGIVVSLSEKAPCLAIIFRNNNYEIFDPLRGSWQVSPHQMDCFLRSYFALFLDQSSILVQNVRRF